MSTPSEIIKSERPGWFRVWEGVQYGVLAASALVVILPILGIFWFLIQKGASAVNWEFITRPPEQFIIVPLMPV